MSTGWRIFWIAMTLLVMLAIFLLSAQGHTESKALSGSVEKILKVEDEGGQQDKPLVLGFSLRKLAHIILFCGLGFCSLGAIGRWWGAALFSYGYAVLDEIHQHLSGRNGQWTDTLIDLIGIALGICLMLAGTWMLKRIQENREKEKKEKEAKA